MNTIKYSQHLFTALSAAGKAGRAILEVYYTDFAVEHKDDTSPLTLADKHSHEVITKDLKTLTTGNNSGNANAVSSLPVLSEEGKEIPYTERRYWESFWLVDPLDGTKEFIKRNGEFTVNIALIHKNRPVLGCIYVPVTDVLYFACEGLGAYRRENNQGIANVLSLKELVDSSERLPSRHTHKKNVENNRSPDEDGIHLTVIGSRSHPSEQFAKFVESLRGEGRKIEIISAGSSLKFCLLAEGKADIYPRFGPTMEWDTAAGQAIVEQSNGKIMDAETNMPLKYNKENLVNPFFIGMGENSPLPPITGQ
ncbi:3'(2'),5'-bisphosphate nucleotidase CysQ [uncultured Candidatus Kuenenia sp.]|jgi:3'(2'), 5'-bisphosphate nucleotidase|uniref:3'(2'),5'-bisphosphate nucleotidase CysQ family protein n=1 Tax=uncultured Candidatus Kuenenia sp. TaxID=1048336 RepID=UPI0025F4BCE7|nr:3'(2'),5'-bisphosphate nucleotidase CysQ [uncultured Candidatus Kuenenia sp.]